MEKEISIIYICIGKYVKLWDEFYLSCEQFLLPGYRKKYYVFGDFRNLRFEERNNITKIFQEDLGWPKNTLMRFHMMQNVKEQLLKSDFSFFFNANLKFTEQIGEEILPTGLDNYVGAKHPGMYVTWNDADEFPYSRDINSQAFIPMGHGETYFQGALFGGRSDAFVEMVDTLREWIDADLSKNVIPIFHDESFLNKFFVDRHDVKILDAGYIYPEGWILPCRQIVLSRDKRKYFDVEKLKLSRSERLQKQFAKLMRVLKGREKI